MTKSLVLAALGRWPGLDPAERYEGHDLAVTTDFRDLFGEVVSAHLGARALDQIFPGRLADPSRSRSIQNLTRTCRPVLVASAALLGACASQRTPDPRPVASQSPCPDSVRPGGRDSIDLTHDVRRGPRIGIDSTGAMHPLPPIPVRDDSAPCSPASDTTGRSSTP